MGLFKMIAQVRQKVVRLYRTARHTSAVLQALGWSKQQCKIIVVGLDNSGKSTLINHLKPKKVRVFVYTSLLSSSWCQESDHIHSQSASYEVVPTVGFSEEHFEKGRLAFQVFDMSGAGTYRSLWESYYKGVDAVIFVVDSTDRIRMAVAKDELDGMLAHKDLKDLRVPVLLFANKMDLPSALEPSDIMALLGLQVRHSRSVQCMPRIVSCFSTSDSYCMQAITSKPWHIQASNALSGDGVDAGVNWLADQLARAAATDSKGASGGAVSGGGGAGSSSTPARK
jgi:ADP-ribosylation factor-like protein 6